MVMITSTQLSNHRKKLRNLLDRIDELAFKSAHIDPLIKGSPVEVYRSCGKASCGCSTDTSKRHGPYRVVQIYRKGKQRQVSLKKSETILWKKVNHYQSQMKHFSALKNYLSELEILVTDMIRARLEELPK